VTAVAVVVVVVVAVVVPMRLHGVWVPRVASVSVGAAGEGRAAQLEQEPASYGAAAVSTSCMDCSYGGRVLCMVEVPVDPRPVGDSWRMASTTVTLAD
jgi:hypothetical protein